MSYNYIIEKRIINNDILKLFDIYIYWRLKKLKRYYIESRVFAYINDDDEKKNYLNYNLLLDIRSSRKIKTKKRFKYISNRLKITLANRVRNRQKERQQVFDNFIQRKLSKFKYTNIIDLTTKMSTS